MRGGRGKTGEDGGEISKWKFEISKEGRTDLTDRTDWTDRMISFGSGCGRAPRCTWI
ncbi:hypothetical protein SBV1_1150025 [Verrucomicrobia bacterium]|nr:hypothetical protein SBV1_1150025 [Verrucomicrobiota bacterium]